MKLFVLCLLITFTSHAQNITGKWATIDDESGQQKSIVEIYERAGKVYGKVVKIFPGPNDDPDPVCEGCSTDDDRYKKKIIGMEIIKDMKKSDGSWTDGTILDPENGKVYRCKLWIEDNSLKVRGFWGPLYRTQTWRKVQ